MAPKDATNEGKGKKWSDPNKGDKGGKGGAQPPLPKPVAPILDFPVFASQPALVSAPEIRKWCFQNNIPVLTSKNPIPLFTLNQSNVVTVRQQNIRVPGSDASWAEILYDGKTGWVNEVFLDDYNDGFPAGDVAIDHAMKHPIARQYMTLEIDPVDNEEAKFKDVIRYDMCGEICVAFIVQDGIDSVLTKWKTKSRNTYDHVLAADKNGSTEDWELKPMLDAVLGEYGFSADPDQIIFFNKRLTFPVSVDKMKEDLNKMLGTHSLIVLVTIDQPAGALISNTNEKTLHWVVVDKLTP